MKKALLVSLLALALAIPAAADLQKAAEQDAQFAPHGQAGGGAAVCTYAYYNLCSGWLWIWSGWGPGDEVGVTFDLASCGGGNCCLSFYWYWRYTSPTYGFTVTYNLYDADGAGCKVGASNGTLAAHDPIERWNFVGGLGCSSAADAVLTSTWDAGTLPYVGTEQNGPSAGYPVICAGIVFEGNSYVYQAGVTSYCPPSPMADGGGVVDIIMVAFMDCTPSSTEDASWSDVKGLFR